MLRERSISEKWVWLTISTFTKKWQAEDGNSHFAKPILERDGRILHVVINQNVEPQIIVTVFFDRRLRNLGNQP
jgi:hypothetical protein